MESEWWNLHPEDLRSELAEDLKKLGDHVTMDQIREVQAKAIRRGNQINFRANVCQEFPQGSPFPSDVILRTQEDVEEFAQLNCSIIKGRLRISNTVRRNPNPQSTQLIFEHEITDLTPLSHIEYVGGKLTIDNNVLQSLDGLENIHSIGPLGMFGGALISGRKLLDIEALQGVNKMYGDLVIRNTRRLKTISQAFNHAHFLPKNISDNQPSDKSNVYFQNNDGLESIEGFSNASMLRELIFSHNKSLTSINGFNQLERLDHYLFIQNNLKLKSLQGFNSLHSIELHLTITENPNLKECCVFFPLICTDPPHCIENGVSSNHITILNNAPSCTEEEIIDNGFCM